MREYLSAAGNNVLEDERRAASGVLEEMDLLAGYQRFSEGIAERRDADLSVSPPPTTRLSGHHPLLKQSPMEKPRTYNL